MAHQQQPELCFEAPVPVKDAHKRPEMHFLQLTTPAGIKGIQVSIDTANTIDLEVRRAVAQQLHQWFEVDDQQKSIDAYFEIHQTLRSAIIALQCVGRSGVEPLPPPPPPPDRWCLAGLEFSETTGRFSYRLEPELPQKLKLRAAVSPAMQQQQQQQQQQQHDVQRLPEAFSAVDAFGSTEEAMLEMVRNSHPARRKYRAGTPAVRRDFTDPPPGTTAAEEEQVVASFPNDVLTLAASEAAAEEYLREYTAAIEQARQIRMDASRRFMEKMGVADSANNA